MGGENELDKLHYYQQKLPDFFNSPQISSKYIKQEFKMIKGSSEKILKINHIIEQCKQAIKLKPPKHLPKITFK